MGTVRVYLLLILVGASLCTTDPTSTQITLDMGGDLMLDTTVIPSISHSSISGTFAVDMLNGAKLDAIVRIDFQDNQITVTGCNLHTSTYALDTEFKVLEDFTSTKKACSEDVDITVIDALKKSIKLQFDENKPTFFAQDGSETIKLITEARRKDDSQLTSIGSGSATTTTTTTFETTSMESGVAPIIIEESTGSSASAAASLDQNGINIADLTTITTGNGQNLQIDLGSIDGSNIFTTGSTSESSQRSESSTVIIKESSSSSSSSSSSGSSSSSSSSFNSGSGSSGSGSLVISGSSSASSGTSGSSALQIGTISEASGSSTSASFTMNKKQKQISLNIGDITLPPKEGQIKQTSTIIISPQQNKVPLTTQNPSTLSSSSGSTTSTITQPIIPNPTATNTVIVPIKQTAPVVEKTPTITTTTTTTTTTINKPAQNLIITSGSGSSILNQGVTGSVINQAMGSFDMVIRGLDLVVAGGKYTLTGCNTHTFTYALKSNGQVLYGNPASTRKGCEPNFDRFYLDAFSKIRTILIVDRGYNCVDENGIIVLRFQSIGQGTGPSGEGQFKVLFPTVDLTIDESYIRFEACNINSAPYKIEGGSIKIETFFSTLRACNFFDFDNLIVESFKFVNSFQKINGLLKFKSAGGTTLLYAVQKTLVNSSPQPIIVPTPLFKAVQQKTTQPVIVITTPSATVPPKDQGTVVTIPVIKSISLAGNYKFTITNSKLAFIIISLDDQFIEFQGCNLIKLPYVAYDDGTFSVLQGGFLTQRDCEINNDDKYVSLLRSLSKFERKNGAINFLQNSNIIVTLSTKFNQDFSTKITAGVYAFEFAGPEVTVKDNNIILSACNTHIIPFKVDDSHQITFGSVSSTKIGCPNNDDNVYLKAITSSKTIALSSESISFIGSNGLEQIKFFRFLFSTLVPVSPLEGKYQSRIPNNKVKLSISQKTFTIQGCNKITIDYQIAGNGELTFSAPISTKKACEIDYDSLIVNVILKVRQVITTENGIYFLNSFGRQVGRTIKYVAPAAVTIPKVQHKPQVPAKPQAKPFVIPSGNYLINYQKKTGVKAMGCSIKDNKLTLRGCKTYTLNFNAFSDFTIKFEPLSQSQASSRCQIDNDNTFLIQLRDASTFAQINKNFNLFDANKKINLNFALDTSNQDYARDYKSQYDRDYRQKYSQIGLPLYCRQDQLSMNFVSGKDNNVFDWFGLGSRQFGKLVEQPKTIAQAGTRQNSQSFSDWHHSSGDGGFFGGLGSFFGMLNPLNWFGGKSYSQSKYSTERRQSYQNQRYSQSRNYRYGNEGIRQDQKNQNKYNSEASSYKFDANANNKLPASQNPSGTSKPVQVTTNEIQTPQGKYKLSLPKVDLTISKDSFTFKGCNSHRVPCSFRNNRIYFGKPVSTSFRCASDHAANFLNVLPSFVTFKKDLVTGGFTFFNQHLQSLFSIGLKDGAAPGSKVFGEVFEGNFGAQLPDYKVEVGKNSLSFQGCRDNAVSYDYSDYGFVSFKKRESKQKNKCLSDNDDSILGYLKNSAKISYKKDKGYSIQDGYGNDLIHCSPYKW